MDIEFTATLTRRVVTGHGRPSFRHIVGEADVVTEPRIGDTYYEASYNTPRVLFHINYEYW
jgi:hypothetical protein